MSGEYQKELFGEFKKEKGKFKKITDKITKRQQKLYMHVPLENIVFAGIVIIMCIVVAFALGVERGRRFGPSATLEEKESLEEKIILPEIEISATERKTPDAEDRAAPKGLEPKSEESYKPYTIQLISYKQKALAEKEKNRLLNKKVDAFIISSGSWLQVCAGNYVSTKEAKKDLEGFRKKYKSCFIRNK